MRALLLTASLLLFADGPKKDPRKFLYLFDVNLQDGIRVKTGLLPNRVYLRFDREFGYWTFLLTNSRGEFPTPLETLQAGTVVPSPLVGGTDTHQLYALTASGKWIPTKLEEQYHLWIHSQPPSLATRLPSPATQAPQVDPVGAVLGP